MPDIIELRLAARDKRVGKVLSLLDNPRLLEFVIDNSQEFSEFFPNFLTYKFNQFKSNYRKKFIDFGGTISVLMEMLFKLKFMVNKEKTDEKNRKITTDYLHLLINTFSDKKAPMQLENLAYLLIDVDEKTKGYTENNELINTLFSAIKEISKSPLACFYKTNQIHPGHSLLELFKEEYFFPDKRIDLFKLTEKNAKNIYQLLKENKAICFFSANKNYQLKNGEWIKLTNPILIMGDKLNNNLEYLVLDNNLLATGNVFSEIYAIKSQLIFDGDKVNLAQEKKYRLVKFQADHVDFPIENFINEFELTKKTPYLNANSFSLTNNKPLIEYAFIENIISGCELFEIIKNDISNRNTLSIIDRFQLSRSLIESYKKEVYQSGLVHRDIKPENIIVSLNPDFLELHFIDFGLAKKIEDNDFEFNGGTMPYISPEVLTNKGSDTRSDIFSLGVILMMIWRNFDEMFFGKEWALYKPFYGIPEETLPIKSQNDLKNLFNKMISEEKNNRPSLEEIIDTIRMIHFENMHLLSPTSSTGHDVLKPIRNQSIPEKTDKQKHRIHISINVHDELIERINKILTQVLSYASNKSENKLYLEDQKVKIINCLKENRIESLGYLVDFCFEISIPKSCCHFFKAKFGQTKMAKTFYHLLERNVVILNQLFGIESVVDFKKMVANYVNSDNLIPFNL